MLNNTITIFYTAYLVNDWNEIISNHILRIVNFRLSDVASIKVFANSPSNESAKELIEILQNSNMKFEVTFSSTNEFEFPALKAMLSSESDFCLYMHTKSVTKSGKEKENSLAWNNYMTTFVVDKWKNCLLELETADCVGVDFHLSPFPHYSGNFFWVSNKHLSKLQNFLFSNRFSAEKFIASVPGTYISLQESAINLYKEKIAESKLKTINKKEYKIQ